MKKRISLTPAERQLIRRYLIWCYKTTKESLDRVDRYFTQLKVDHYVLALLSSKKECKDPDYGTDYLKKVDAFQQYIEEKGERVFPQKYVDYKKEKLQPDYWYCKARLESVEDAVVYFLGKAQLKKIQETYEDEMTRRIWEAREEH